MPLEASLEDLQASLRVTRLSVGISQTSEYEALGILLVLLLESANLAGFDMVGLHGPAATGWVKGSHRAEAPMNSLQGTRPDPRKSTKMGAFRLPRTAVRASLPDAR
jgi:hypothetical protein